MSHNFSIPYKVDTQLSQITDESTHTLIRLRGKILIRYWRPYPNKEKSTFSIAQGQVVRGVISPIGLVFQFTRVIHQCKRVTVPFEWFYDPFLPSLSDL